MPFIYHKFIPLYLITWTFYIVRNKRCQRPTPMKNISQIPNTWSYLYPYISYRWLQIWLWNRPMVRVTFPEVNHKQIQCLLYITFSFFTKHPVSEHYSPEKHTSVQQNWACFSSGTRGGWRETAMDHVSPLSWQDLHIFTKLYTHPETPQCPVPEHYSSEK